MLLGWIGCWCAITCAAQLPTFEGLKRLNGTNLFVRVVGKGDPLVIMHGGPGMNQSYLVPHLMPLAKRYQLIFFDQRASGQSAVPLPDSISLDFTADDIEAIRQEWKLEKISLLSHSWGVIPAVHYALDHPDRVHKMIWCNPVPLSTEYNTDLALAQQKRMTRQDSVDRARILQSPEFKAGDAQAYHQLLLLSFRHSFHNSIQAKKFIYETPANYVQASRALFAGMGDDLSEYNYYNNLKECVAPVLILHGTYDAIPLSIQQRAIENLPKGFLRTFPASGHFVFIDEPDRFRKEVIGFLSPTPPKKGAKKK